MIKLLSASKEYLQEVLREGRAVSWPTWPHALKQFAIVLLFSAVLIAFLYSLDLLFAKAIVFLKGLVK